MNLNADSFAVLTPNPRRSSRTRARCRAILERRKKRTSPIIGIMALGGLGAVYLVAIVLNALRLYSSRLID